MAGAPAPKPPELAQLGKPTPAEAAKLLEQFRHAGLPGDYFLEFELRGLPRRGEGITLKGRWWGTRNDDGALSRIELIDGAGVSHRLVLQNGERAAVWRWADGHAARAGVADLMAPVVPSVEISAFDLQMPFLYWPGATVEKITRALGRPAYEFLFPAPAAFAAQNAGGISAMRAYFDTQFNAPVRTEVIANGTVTKTLELLSLKTVDKQTLPKAVDYRNEQTRDKTRLQITGAALNLRWPASLFDPATLGQPASAPAPDRITRIEP
ncbi:MAG: hypothetical protein ABIQ12_05620 [Opitutaceae bacterium]